jgi:hypothetical protein
LMKKVKKIIKSKKKVRLIEPALLSEAALAKDWNRAEEEKVWNKFEKDIADAFEKIP